MTTYREGFAAILAGVEEHESRHGGHVCPDERYFAVATLALALGLTPEQLVNVALAMLRLAAPPADAN